MLESTPIDSGTIVRGWIRSALLGFTALSILMVLTPQLLLVLGPVVVVAGPLLSVLLLTVRRFTRDRTLRPLLLGASVAFALIFVYGFSPPVLERIGHAIGWPGTTLRLWERFTAPVYDYCGSTVWFWRILELWDILTVMIVDHLEGSMAISIVFQGIVLAAFVFGLVTLNRVRQASHAGKSEAGTSRVE